MIPAFLILYIIVTVTVTIIVDRRLNRIAERHHEKIGGGYASYGLFKLNNRLKLTLWILTALLVISTCTITLLVIA